MLRKFKFAVLLFSFTTILILTGCTEDPLPPAEEHYEAIGVYLSISGIEAASILRGVTDDTLTAPLGDISESIDVKFYNKNEEIIDPPAGGQTLVFEIEDSTVVSVFQYPGEEGSFKFHLRGKQTGNTHIELFIMHEGHSDFRSGKIPVRTEEQSRSQGRTAGL